MKIVNNVKHAGQWHADVTWKTVLLAATCLPSMIGRQGTWKNRLSKEWNVYTSLFGHIDQSMIPDRPISQGKHSKQLPSISAFLSSMEK